MTENNIKNIESPRVSSFDVPRRDQVRRQARARPGGRRVRSCLAEFHRARIGADHFHGLLGARARFGADPFQGLLGARAREIRVIST
eukprot:CAMPEP_0174902140 /NCGR_PEP_ID=MMETSP0167-20121228/36974_1 /TAXON_ID=38298 /ORGANISM="Rhodella maculata, Strain CCMP736" /LENGTH=86 /DNA_ID=CAMNT_0016144051 /DNA_START=417 /DNA_END=673 /DNA_ORIENTATION=-